MVDFGLLKVSMLRNIVDYADKMDNNLKMREKNRIEKPKDERAD